ncbi:MAG: sigma-70 family RNA polymerase sigma factor [Deltaproteobacteria bacterium]|nr:sigma-70 family RNA polymerase sigma factor [Deltaproteobacteria bacterium]
MESTPRPPMAASVVYLGGDGELVAGLKARNPAAERAFFSRYARVVERLLRGVLGPHAELADAVQDTFISAFRQVHALRSHEALTVWLRTIATGVAHNRIRAKTRNRWLLFFSPESMPDEARAPRSAEATEALRSVYAVLEQLPISERVAFSLRYIEDMTVPEIAASTQASESTVKRRLREGEHLFAHASRRCPALEEWLQEERVWSS